MTLLIKNVQILGGSKPFTEPCDVFVSGEKISAIGNFPNKKADITVDGQGAYLSPGFIDVDTDSDHYLSLFEHPEQEDFLRQGVTTIFGGMCGASLAPLLYGGLESFEKWGETDRINVNWHSVDELLETLSRRKLGVNFGTLVGHTTIRRAIIGETPRDLTKNEFKVMGEIVKRSLKEGGFGVSTGLAYVHAKNTPYSELRFLADLVKGYGGVYATHLRETGREVAAAVNETIRLAEETGVKTLISHFTPVLGAEREYENALHAIASLDDEVDLHFDAYPSSSSLLALYTFLPEWAQTGGIEVMLANIKDEWLAKKIKKDMPHLDEEHFVIAQAPGNDFLVGKTLAEIKNLYGMKDGRDALFKLMATMRMRGGVLYRNIASETTKLALKDLHSLIASNAPSFSDTFRGRQLKSERTTRTFTDFLKLVEDGSLMPLEDAIAKLTSIPAKFFGLAQRGTVTEGYFADLTCFKGAEVRFTVVNGQLAMLDGGPKEIRAGKALRHVAPKSHA